MVFPPYDAEIACVPVARLVVENVAFPVPSRVLVPSCVFPSEKATEPVGTPLPDAGETSAEKVILVPATAVVLEEVSLVVVAIVTGAAFTVRLIAADSLTANVSSPG